MREGPQSTCPALPPTACGPSPPTTQPWPRCVAHDGARVAVRQAALAPKAAGSSDRHGPGWAGGRTGTRPPHSFLPAGQSRVPTCVVQGRLCPGVAQQDALELKRVGQALGVIVVVQHALGHERDEVACGRCGGTRGGRQVRRRGAAVAGRAGRPGDGDDGHSTTCGGCKAG